jgi:hypothetical protein
MLRALVKLLLLIVLLAVTFSAGWVVARTGMGASVATASLSDRERRFSEQLSGASLVGRFTIAGRDDRQASPDRYDISSVEKVGENQWRFNTRMRYGSVDATVPVVVPMQWVDDTPVITLTDYSIPALGTFTARVFFYGDRYAGTWQHGKVGGHLFGRIERQ